jgi:fatty-acyl-CoA synthase
MFHVNAWGLPFIALLTGANLVLPGPFLDPVSVLELLSGERVTYTAGVPTVWLGVLAELDRRPGAWDLSALTNITVGGSAAAPALIDAFGRRHGLRVVHAWGMTESAPIGSVSWLPPDMDANTEDTRLAMRARQGRPVPLMEFRAHGEQGPVPWDGVTMGELEMRSPWVASRYVNESGPDDRFTPDGWFRTGDVVTIDPRGAIDIRDRAKDLVKSGGEWISSIALENALLDHPAVAEAAVVAVPHAKWDERPLAVVVVRPGETTTADELLASLAPRFARWWLPDAVEFVDAIPRTSTGKFLKSALRDRFRDRYRVGTGA